MTVSLPQSIILQRRTLNTLVVAIVIAAVNLFLRNNNPIDRMLNGLTLSHYLFIFILLAMLKTGK